MAGVSRTMERYEPSVTNSNARSVAPAVELLGIVFTLPVTDFAGPVQHAPRPPR